MGIPLEPLFVSLGYLSYQRDDHREPLLKSDPEVRLQSYQDEDYANDTICTCQGPMGPLYEGGIHP